jgi:IMP and pyridine-specific 5'-nucleotidase
MTTRYRVEYALKAHRRDALIEFIKGLMAVPFVLHSPPTSKAGFPAMAAEAQRRYCEIMRDVEVLVNDHIECDRAGHIERSKLRFLVPSVGRFFTPLLLEKAFMAQDERRAISSRRFVAPSFNDIRLVLNSAQIMSLATLNGPLKLVTFDGDLTLYEDGQSLTSENPVIPPIMSLLKRGICVGIVTAAGYTEAVRYYERLHGLLEAIRDSTELSAVQKENLIILGGESSYLFKCSPTSQYLLESVPRVEWQLDEMKVWSDNDIQHLLDLAESSLKESVQAMRLPATGIRKERAVGIIHNQGGRFPREQLEETVLAVQKALEVSDVGRKLPFTAFNGGNDGKLGSDSVVDLCTDYVLISRPVFVDVGDKRWVALLARYACTHRT